MPANESPAAHSAASIHRSVREESLVAPTVLDRNRRVPANRRSSHHRDVSRLRSASRGVEDSYAMLSPMPNPGTSRSGWRRDLTHLLRDKRAKVGVVGLGYVGLPMLLSAVRAGFRGVGVDVDADRVATLKAGRSYISDVSDAMLRDDLKRMRVSEKPSALKGCDVILICVPTP